MGGGAGLEVVGEEGGADRHVAFAGRRREIELGDERAVDAEVAGVAVHDEIDRVGAALGGVEIERALLERVAAARRQIPIAVRGDDQAVGWGLAKPEEDAVVEADVVGRRVRIGELRVGDEAFDVDARGGFGDLLRIMESF